MGLLVHEYLGLPPKQLGNSDAHVSKAQYCSQQPGYFNSEYLDIDDGIFENNERIMRIFFDEPEDWLRMRKGVSREEGALTVVKKMLKNFLTCVTQKRSPSTKTFQFGKIIDVLG